MNPLKYIVHTCYLLASCESPTIGQKKSGRQNFKYLCGRSPFPYRFPSSPSPKKGAGQSAQINYLVTFILREIVRKWETDPELQTNPQPDRESLSSDIGDNKT